MKEIQGVRMRKDLKQSIQKMNYQSHSKNLSKKIYYKNTFNDFI